MAEQLSNEFDSNHFINRELSWLEFNARVLEEAWDTANPLLERLKFWCIFSSNLDEFFEVRVAGIKQQIESKVTSRGPDGLRPSEVFQRVSEKASALVDDQYRLWREELKPQLAQAGIQFLRLEDLSGEDWQWLEDTYRSEVRPVLTPLSIDPSHPFPQLLNKSLNVIVRLNLAENEGELKGRRKKSGLTKLAVVQAPRVLPRLLELPGRKVGKDFVFLADVIGHFLGDLFPGAEIEGFWRFRLTRNSELYIDEEDVENLLQAVEKELSRRRRGNAVRLEVDSHCPESIVKPLLKTLGLGKQDLYMVDGPINPTRLMAVYGSVDSPKHSDRSFAAPLAKGLSPNDDLFEVIKKKDLLLHHPYDSFETVVDLLEKSAADDQVLAIKQTLYRTGGDPRIVGALMAAAQRGKQVTAVVELRARFDEANNIEWARKLEDAGVHVVYGLVGLKIHCKLCMVVRRESDGLRRYLHLGTGNYNASTAKVYTDLGLLTCHPELGEDVTNLFNLMTGVSQFPGMSHLLVAHFEMREKLLNLIERERANAVRGIPARIIVKMNSLVDPSLIQALYRASKAGVKIDLIIRGICCLQPGLPGVSENIRVISIVGRFLEHSRIIYFENACKPAIFVGSADWMPRNLYRRVEVLFPILDGRIREQIIAGILEPTLRDNVKARVLEMDGVYRRNTPKPVKKRFSSQEHFMAETRKTRKGGVKEGRFSRVKLRQRPS